MFAKSQAKQYADLAKEIDQINEGGTGASWYPIAVEKIHELAKNGDTNASKLVSHLAIVETGSDNYNRGVEAFIHSMEGDSKYGSRGGDVKYALALASKHADIPAPVTAGKTSAKPPVADVDEESSKVPTDTKAIPHVNAEAVADKQEPVNITGNFRRSLRDFLADVTKPRRRH